MPLATKSVPSPVGTLRLVATDEALIALLWTGLRPDNVALPAQISLEGAHEDPNHPILLAAEAQLTEYFAGTRREFDLPIEMRGTEFQKQCWEQLLAIPFGETRSYQQIANALGNPKSTRAVGAANGRNPISIIVPCHRVIGSSGSLTGFGGGMENKALLLALEGSATPSLL
jgi:methylated-DNA-[protein]-cysteine S-methyltransferase